MITMGTDGKMAVTCDGCGERIYDGYRSYTEHMGADGNVNGFVLGDQHYCDNCEELAGEHPAEFRTCDYCGTPFSEGFTVEGGGWYCCGDCFDDMMDADYPFGWEPNGHDIDHGWCGGYYDYRAGDGTWHDTGIFYTEWY